MILMLSHLDKKRRAIKMAANRTKTRGHPRSLFSRRRTKANALRLGEVALVVALLESDTLSSWEERLGVETLVDISLPQAEQ